MAATNMLRLTHNFSLLSVNTSHWNIVVRSISKKNLLMKLGLPEKPKRPSPPFFQFRSEIHEELKKNHPNSTFAEISRAAAARWKEFDVNKKEEMLKTYKKKFEKYLNDVQKYEASLSSGQRKELKENEEDIKALKEHRMMKLIRKKRMEDLKKPKRPLTPFFRFISKQTKLANESSSEFSKRLGEEWEAMSSLKKEVYCRGYEVEMEEYNNALLKWEEDMISKGHMDVVRSKTLKNKLKAYAV